MLILFISQCFGLGNVFIVVVVDIMLALFRIISVELDTIGHHVFHLKGIVL